MAVIRNGGEGLFQTGHFEVTECNVDDYLNKPEKY